MPAAPLAATEGLTARYCRNKHLAVTALRTYSSRYFTARLASVESVRLITLMPLHSADHPACSLHMQSLTAADGVESLISATVAVSEIPPTSHEYITGSDA